jgi:hypothetical protein
MKYEGISASNFTINKEIRTLEKWNQEAILSRNAWIVEAVVKMVGDQWVKNGSFELKPWKG